MSELRFRFRLEKLLNALAYFASRSDVRDFTKLKALKMLYLADRDHLFRHGRPIMGDRYVAMNYGPVPESAYQIINSLECPELPEDDTTKAAQSVIQSHRRFYESYARLRAKQRPDLNVFSDSDIESLDRIAKEFGKTPARQLVDLTHEHRSYQMADAGRPPGSSVPLPYEWFFADAPEDGAICKEWVQLEQADRDFAEALKKTAKKHQLLTAIR